MWVVQKENILEEIKQIMMIRDRRAFNAKIILFFHKIDLINITTREVEIIKIRKLINESLGVPIYFTSLYPELIFNLYNAFNEIVAKFSGESMQIKKVLDNILKDLSKTMFFITNKYQSIISQASTEDFDYSIINHFHKLTAQLNQNFEDMCLNDNIRQLILVSEKELKIYMRFLNLTEHELMNVICVSEILDLNEIFDLTKKIMLQLSDIYQNKKKM